MAVVAGILGSAGRPRLLHAPEGEIGDLPRLRNSGPFQVDPSEPSAMPGLAYGDFGDPALKAFMVGGRGSGLPLVDIGDDDLRRGDGDRPVTILKPGSTCTARCGTAIAS